MLLPKEAKTETGVRQREFEGAEEEGEGEGEGGFIPYRRRRGLWVLRWVAMDGQLGFPSSARRVDLTAA